MRISDLQKLLAKTKRKHGDLEVIETRYSDYCLMGLEDWSIVRAAKKPNDDWLMAEHRSMTDEQRALMNFLPYLHFRGN